MQFNTTPKGETFGRFAAFAAAAAVFAAAGAPTASAALLDLTSITTQTTTGTPTTLTGITAVGQSGGAYKTGGTFAMAYDGEVQALQTISAGGLTYTSTGRMATTVVRRNVGANNDTIWYAGSQSTFKSGSTITLRGPNVTSYDQLFGTNNVLVGADNLFVTSGSPAGNSANVDRVDMLFTAGLKASNASAFSVMDRGASNDHDAVQLAAVTALDADGNPAAYGPVITLSTGTWGKTDLVPTAGEVVVRRDNTSPTGAPISPAGSVNLAPFHPSDYVTQSVGGVLVRTSDLVPAGTTIYGYSLFSPTTTGTGADLVDWTDGDFYHPADYTSHGGGLDPTATLGVLFTLTSVPEPTTLGLAATVGAGLLARRRAGRGRLPAGPTALV